MERNRLPANQALDIDLAARDQLHRQPVVARPIPETAADFQLLGARRHDGERDLVPAHAALDVRAALAQRVHRRLHARFGAGRVDRDIKAHRNIGFFAEALRVLGRGRTLPGFEGGGGDVGLCELEAVGRDVDGDDLGGAQGFGDGAAEEADGPGAEDDDAVAVAEVRLLRDVAGDGEGFGEGALLEGDVFGQLVAEVLWEDVVFGQGAVDGGRGGEGHVGTEVVFSFFAALAAPAGDAGFHCDSVSFLEGLDLIADFDDSPCGLVTEDHGVLDHEVPYAALVEVVDVAAADAGEVDLEEDIMRRLERGYGAVFIDDLLGA